MERAIALSNRVSGMPQSGIREIFDKAQEYDELLDLSIGEPDFVTPKPIREAVSDAIVDGASSYTPTLGRTSLRQKLATKLAEKNNIQVDPSSELIVTPGAMGALFVAVHSLCNPGDQVLVPEPYWPNYHGHLASAEAELIPVPTTLEKDFVPQPDDIEAAITDETKGILLNTPNNPTGAVIPEARLREIGTILESHDLWAIVDETYEDLLYGDAKHYSMASSPDLFDRIITVNSFSKSYAMTGWRLGYASGPKTLLDGMRVLQEHTISSAAEPSQVAAEAALDNPEIVSDIRGEFENRREKVLEILSDTDGVSVSPPKGAFYIFADISAVADSSRDFVEKLLEDVQVAIVPGSVFGAEGYVRFSYATDLDTIEEGLHRFKSFTESQL